MNWGKRKGERAQLWRSGLLFAFDTFLFRNNYLFTHIIVLTIHT